MKSEKRQS